MQSAPTSKNPKVNEVLRSQHCMAEVTKFLQPKEFLKMNKLNKDFYNRVVPLVSKNRKLFKSAGDEKTYYYMREKEMWAMPFSNNTPTREVDFEEDLWRHDIHYVPTDANTKPRLLWTLDELRALDGDCKLADNEEIIMQFVTELKHGHFLCWPVKEVNEISRGLYITVDSNGKKTYKRVSAPPTKLLRPGMCPQRNKHGEVTDILFLGGVKERQCHCYNLEKDTWRLAGCLPDKHLITQQNCAQYKDGQTLTFFTSVNFDVNKFVLNVAMNKGAVPAEGHGDEKWEWCFRTEVDVENYCVKSGFIYEDNLCIFARGRPRDCEEQCISMMIIYHLKFENGKIVGLEDEYHYYQLYPLLNPEFLVNPKFSKKGGDLFVRFAQEGKYQDTFPFQVGEIKCIGCDMHSIVDLTKGDEVEGQKWEKLVDVVLPSESK